MSDLHSTGTPEGVHEESDVDVSAILRYGLGLAALVTVVQFLLWWLLGAYTRHGEQAQTRAYPLAATQEQLPPGPRLQNRPQQDMRELREKQRALLQGYAWVDRDGGIARIPIEDAMRIVVERGLPAREATK